MADLGFELNVEVLAGINLVLVALDLILPVLLVEATFALQLRDHGSAKLGLLFLELLSGLFLPVLDQLVLAVQVSVTTV